MASQVDPARRQAEARAAITASLNDVGTSITSDLQSRAADIHSNSSSLAKQQADVAKQTAALSKQSDQYQKLADQSGAKLKEIGDIQNWAELIERDLMIVEKTLELAEQSSGHGGTNGAIENGHDSK
jgi:hypothetical protein